MLVFNFHHVEATLKRPERKHITISPEGLRRFIGTLRLMGMEIVPLQTVLETPDFPVDDPRKVVLTFDDGYVNNYEQAAPVLEAEQCPATIFVLPGRLGGTNEWDQGELPESERDALMTLAQMQALDRSPYITFGSHGLSHRDFSMLDGAALHAEIHESYHLLQDALGAAFLPVLAYPWGCYSPQVVQAMAQSPYRAAFTVETAMWQSTTPRFEIPRYSAYYRDGNPVIALAKLARHKLLFA